MSAVEKVPMWKQLKERDGEIAPLTPEQRIEIAAAVADLNTGFVEAARAAGVVGTAGEIRRLLDEDEEFQAARDQGRRAYFAAIGAAPRNAFEALARAMNEGSVRAAEDLLEIHGVFKRGQVVEHTGEVGNPDVAAAVDRFTELVANAVGRAAPRGAEGEAPRQLDRGGEG